MGKDVLEKPGFLACGNTKGASRLRNPNVKTTRLTIRLCNLNFISSFFSE
jgi:hypothetical protein